MPELPLLVCPSCGRPIAAVEYSDKLPVATEYDDCLRRCGFCEIAASNAADPDNVTYIYRDPLEIVPLPVEIVEAGAEG